MSDAVATLPPKTAALQRAVARTCADLGNIPVPIRTVWNPDDCPSVFLPHLAWALSVDRWEDQWNDATKRAAIKASYAIHRKKGTIAAVQRIVETLGFLIRIVEWWQTEPRGERGTFALEIGVLDAGITDEMFIELERLIDDAKPKSRHLTSLSIHLETRVAQAICIGAYYGDEVTVYPYTPELISITVTHSSNAIDNSVDTMIIYPFTV
jgi:phage tail P2-like protein